MISDLAPGARVTLDVSARGLFDRLPAAGRVQVGVRSGGAQHERMGLVGDVLAERDRLRLAGAEHDATLDPAAVDAIVFSLGQGMRGRLLPRVELFDRHGEQLLQIVGLGEEPTLRTALADLGILDAVPPPAIEPPEPEGDPAADPSAAPFRNAVASGAEIAVEMRRPHATSRWRGRLGEVRFSERFINLIEPGFHLHLRSGTVSTWRPAPEGDAIALEALDRSGAPLGLVIVGPAVLGESVQ